MRSRMLAPSGRKRALRAQPVDAISEALGHDPDGEALSDPKRGGPAEVLAKRAGSQHPKVRRQRVDVSGLEEEAVLAVGHELRGAADIAHDHRLAERQGLE